VALVIEIYEGEITTTMVIKNSWDVLSVTGYHSLYDELGNATEVDYALPVTEEPIGEVPLYKNLTVDVSAGSEWPTNFRIEVVVDDNGTERTIKNYYSVVTPYVLTEEIIISGGFNTTSQDAPNYRPYQTIREMESLARHIIEGYTGRMFGRTYTAMDFDGTDKDMLYCDEHFLWVGAVAVRDEAIFAPALDTTVEISPSGHLLYIRDGDEHLGFPSGYKYRVVGIFGENDVPYDVTLAAKMLAIHYLCNDSAQQNAYVDQVKFGESATRTNRLAFAGTGLLAVDRLLEKYRFHNFRVL
jgi:hypothetical protein